MVRGAYHHAPTMRLNQKAHCFGAAYLGVLGYTVEFASGRPRTTPCTSRSRVIVVQLGMRRSHEIQALRGTVRGTVRKYYLLSSRAGELMFMS